MTPKTNHRPSNDPSDANSALAYQFWLARCFRDGSPEEDLLRAVCANSINANSVNSKSRTERLPLQARSG